MSMYSISSKINDGWLFPPLGMVSSDIHGGPGLDILVAAVLHTPSNKTRLSEPLGAELFTFTPRRLGKRRSLHVACTQADFVESVYET